MAKPASQAGVRRAINQGQFVLFYQPIHDIDTRAIVAAEALLRARRSSGEIRSGAAIASGAEEGPDLYRLDSWTMQRAYRDAAHWQRNGGPNVRLNVNLSPREFAEPNLTPRLRQLVTGYGVDPRKINLEITETSYIADIPETTNVLDELKEIGVGLWADDFGTGHSSLSHLLQFPLDGVKLPQEFVAATPSNLRARTIVKSIIDLAHALEMKVIAEGVEDEDQLSFLRETRCDFIQGFLYSRPMPLKKFEKLLNNGAGDATRSSPAAPRRSRSRAGGRGRASRSS
jgi:EAL domain-containing protein (putative c-di-GMP-specific phosphodiesterase class I)